MDTDPVIPYEHFAEVRIHAGTVVAAVTHPTARNPALVLDIDFGELGIKRSSAQITDNYTAESILGMQVFAVTNFAPMQIGSVVSDCLVLGVYADGSSNVVLATPERPVANGLRLL